LKAAYGVRPVSPKEAFDWLFRRPNQASLMCSRLAQSVPLPHQLGWLLRPALWLVVCAPPGRGRRGYALRRLGLGFCHRH